MLEKTEKWREAHLPTAWDMEPPIEHSVKLIGSNRWALGYNFVCERAQGDVQDALAVWKIKGETYYVRKGDFEAEWKAGSIVEPLAPSAGPSAVHLMGENMVCKIVSMIPNQPSEMDIKRFVRQIAPDIPIPDDYFYQFDEEWERAFFIMERIPGPTLAQVWNDISLPQMDRLVEELLGHVQKMLKHTAPLLSSPGGYGVCDGWLMGSHPEQDGLPHWKPVIAYPICNAKQLRCHLEKIGFAKKNLTWDPAWQRDNTSFHFGHSDLTPMNIIVADTIASKEHRGPRIKSILDWECGGYYPLWWLWYKASFCGALDVPKLPRPYPRDKEPWMFRSTVAGCLKLWTGFDESEQEKREQEKALAAAREDEKSLDPSDPEEALPDIGSLQC